MMHYRNILGSNTDICVRLYFPNLIGCVAFNLDNVLERKIHLDRISFSGP